MEMVLGNLPPSGRVTRRPQHTFNVRHRPFQIAPFMIAPVLPGETLKAFQMQARVVSKPIINPLVGWWIEYYWFYVKHRDLAGSASYQDMVLDPAWNPAGITDASVQVPYYYAVANAGTNWTRRCMTRIVECYFRNEGETWEQWTDGGLPLAEIHGQSWLDSAQLHAEYSEPDTAGQVTIGADDVVTGAEIEKMMEQYNFARMNNLIGEMSYDQFLGTYGVKVPKAELHEPELLRFVREWTYPSNTVDPVTGAPTSAVSWSVQERGDKDRYFKEPGFILGCTIARPKVYLKGQTAAAACAMNTAFGWLPAVAQQDSSMSYLRQPSGKGPLAGLAIDHWFDVRDLLIYGDQYVNYAIAADAKNNWVQLPTAGLEKRHPTTADIDGLFKGTDKYVEADGIVTLQILGTQVDTSPRSSGNPSV